MQVFYGFLNSIIGKDPFHLLSCQASLSIISITSTAISRPLCLQDHFRRPTVAGTDEGQSTYSSLEVKDHPNKQWRLAEWHGQREEQ
jgi:hypothetical protein